MTGDYITAQSRVPIFCNSEGRGRGSHAVLWVMTAEVGSNLEGLDEGKTEKGEFGKQFYYFYSTKWEGGKTTRPGGNA